MGREVVIRRFETEDAEAVSYVIRETMRVSNLDDYPIERLQPLIDYFSPQKVLHLNAERHCLVAEMDDKIVGTAALEDSELVTFFVLPAYQRTGLGMRLLKAIEEFALRTGLRQLRLEASIMGVQFYETFGYKRTGSVKDGTAGEQVELVKSLC